MGHNDSRSLNWKTCFKKILAPHLLNPSTSEDKNDENGARDAFLNPESDNLSTRTHPNSPESSESIQKDITLPIMKQFTHTDDSNKSFFNGLPPNPEYALSNGKLNDFENPLETEESIAGIIAADAEELGKSLKMCKVSKKNKHFYQAKSSRDVPDWNTAFKTILSPKVMSESSPKFPPLKLEPHELRMVDPSAINPWTFHRLSREEFQPSEKMEDLATQSSSKHSNNKKHYSEAEKNVLNLLRLSRSFKRGNKPYVNTFDGYGINCFKNDKTRFHTENTSSTDNLKNVPPPDESIRTSRSCSKQPTKYNFQRIVGPRK